GHPVWIDDPTFDLENHVHRIGAPPPGDRQALADVVGDIASAQLRRDRPLWEIWALEGLQDGHVAFVAKIHHAAADGVAASALLANVMSTEPEATEPQPPGRPWHPERPPGDLRLILDALRDLVLSFRGLPRLVRRTVRGARAVGQYRKSAEVKPPRPILDTTMASFNGALTPHRVFATASLPLEDFKRAKSAFGVTLNDVVLAVVAGSMRRYLDDRGERLPKPLVAGIPVSTDQADAVKRLGGNKVSNLFTSLCTDIDDPVERLRAIHRVTRAGKDVYNLLGADMMADWVELTPPGPFAWAMRQYSKRGLAAKHRPPINLVVSNVPGPAAPLYVAGARLVALYSVGPVLDSIGLNVTVWSYIDQMNFAALACRERLPEIYRVVDGFADSLGELLKAADREGHG
ncbi:MAG TPA: wax ester/triacylglycerol synthase family O-acyltransferase, partial [Actinomycetota bacterium]|nr:wax ester/triacylglycerol synthase family O-acyltransferase [Actinomycetota bacterium]